MTRLVIAERIRDKRKYVVSYIQFSLVVEAEIIEEILEILN